MYFKAQKNSEFKSQLVVNNFKSLENFTFNAN